VELSFSFGPTPRAVAVVNGVSATVQLKPIEDAGAPEVQVGNISSLACSLWLDDVVIETQ
jgi:hypothetical protein